MTECTTPCDFTPIESAFRREFVELVHAHGWTINAPDSPDILLEWTKDEPGFERLIVLDPFMGNDAACVAIIPQVKIVQFRVDFLIACRNPNRGMNVMVVECDGRDFHERTVEQAVRDRRRDGRLLRLGLPTLRFMGTELFNNPIECADEALVTLLACPLFA